MEEPKLSDKELYAIFENCGWYQGRKVDISEDLPQGYKDLPKPIYMFLEEFMGLTLKHKYESKYEFYGELRKSLVETEIIILPDFGYDGCLDDTAHQHFSKILDKKLYPLSMLGHAYAALDVDLNMYIFEMGFGCLRISDNPIDGLRKILLNSLYKDVYELREKGENQYEWRKRKSSYD